MLVSGGALDLWNRFISAITITCDIWPAMTYQLYDNWFKPANLSVSEVLHNWSCVFQQTFLCKQSILRWRSRLCNRRKATDVSIAFSRRATLFSFSVFVFQSPVSVQSCVSHVDQCVPMADLKWLYTFHDTSRVVDSSDIFEKDNFAFWSFALWNATLSNVTESQSTLSCCTIHCFLVHDWKTVLKRAGPVNVWLNRWP